MLLGLQSSPVQANICKYMKLDHLYQTQRRAKHNEVFQHLPAYSFQFHGGWRKWMNMMHVLLRSVPHQKSLANPSSAALGNTNRAPIWSWSGSKPFKQIRPRFDMEQELATSKTTAISTSVQRKQLPVVYIKKKMRRFSLMCAQRWLNQLVRACCVLDVARFHSIWYQSAPFYKHCTCAD